MKLTDKQKAFCDYYIISLNATDSYKKSGYHYKNDNVAGVEAYKLLRNPKVKACIDDRLEKIASSRIATAQEVLEYLTSVVRGKQTEEMVIVEGIGDGCSKGNKIIKNVSIKEQVKAAELLGKRYTLFTDRQEIAGDVTVNVSLDD